MLHALIIIQVYYYTGNLNVQYVSYPIQVVEKWPQDGLMLAFHWEL